jgi:hypothetical protein
LITFYIIRKSTEPDKPTLDKTCSDIEALGLDIDKFEGKKCDIINFWKDHKTLTSLCRRIQIDYSNLDPENLQKAFKDAKEKFEELNLQWSRFKRHFQGKNIFKFDY